MKKCDIQIEKIEEEVKIPHYKNAKEWFKSALLGIFLGLAIIIPGISGAAIAMIFKLYEKMILAISNLLKKFKYSFLFLLPLALGAIAGFLLGFFTIQKLLDIAMLESVCLFAGLMLGSFPTLTDEVKEEKFKKRYIVFIAIGVLVPIGLSLLSVFLGNSDGSTFTSFPIYLYFLCIPIGAFLGMSQTVPGISATAFLMTIGMYSKLVNSVHLSYWKANPQILLIYLILIVSFLVSAFFTSKLINYLLKKYKFPTYYTLIGFCAGTLITMFFNSEINAYYKTLPGSEHFGLHIALSVVLLLIGVAISFSLVLYQRKRSKIAKNPADPA